MNNYSVINSRRITYDDNFNPVYPSIIISSDKQKKTLSEKYGEIAGLTIASKLSVIKDTLENYCKIAADKGLRNFIWYPDNDDINYKEEIISWLKLEGCEVVWGYDQREGTSVKVTF